MRGTIAMLGILLTAGAVSAVPANAVTKPQTAMTTGNAWNGSPLTVGAITLSPGRVTWSDNSVKGGAVWTRVLTKTSSGFAAGPRHKLGNGLAHELSASGLRTAWLSNGNVVVRSGYATTTLPGAYSWLKVSGLRLLATSATQMTLFDLRTGRSTDVMAAYGASPRGYYGDFSADLDGDAFAYAKADETVWVTNLATGTTTQLRTASAPVPAADVAGVEVFAGGGHAGWAYFDSGTCTKTESRVIDVRTGATTADWLADDCSSYQPAVGRLAGLTVDGWLRDKDLENPDASTLDYLYGDMGLMPWTGGALVPIRGNVVDGMYNAYIYAYNTVVNDTESPIYDQPTVTPLTRAVAVHPQSLGNVSAPTAATRGRVWQLIDVTNAVVHTCRVEIRTSTGALIRTLGCMAAWQQGEIRALWDGKTSTGRYAPLGAYTWTIVGGNSTGSLLNSDGSNGPTSGTVLLK